MSKDTNNLIDKVIGFLQGLKTNETEPVKIQVGHGLIKLHAIVDVKNQRITMYSVKGDTELNFDTRKVETIEGMGYCFLKVANIAKGQKNII